MRTREKKSAETQGNYKKWGSESPTYTSPPLGCIELKISSIARPVKFHFYVEGPFSRTASHIYKDELPEINMQKGSRRKVESDSDSDPHYSDYLKQTQAKNKKKECQAKNVLESEESENYFSTSEDEIIYIETSHEGNDGENYEENLEENFEDDFEENFGDNLEENFE